MSGVKMQDIKYQIISALLQKRFANWSVRQLVLTARMASFQWNDLDPRNLLPKRLQYLARDIAPDSVDSFREGLEVESILEPKLSLNKPYTILSIQEYEDFSGQGSEDGWNAFYRKYKRSTGLITVSRQGLSREGTQALMYAGKQSRGLCGYGEMFLMTCIQGRWKVRKAQDCG
jgi:hypothetical protein